uniref:Uncharacterized protein n=1 Tax=Cannabis sativa TaxID=3483 RepID=A0A803Q238_CANSA
MGLLEHHGFYSVRSAYKLIQAQKGNWIATNSSGFWRKLWNLKVPLKALNLRLLIGVRIVATDFCSWFDQILQRCSKDKYAEVIMLCWELWKAQNELVWNQKYATIDVARDSQGELEMAKSHIFAGIGVLNLAEAISIRKRKIGLKLNHSEK